MSKSVHITYVITLSDGENPGDRIRALQLEQSAELPDAVVKKMGMERVTGSISRQETLDERRIEVEIAWPTENFGGEITQFLNVLFGNISMKRGIAISDIRWDDVSPELMRGPAWGIDRIRKSWDIPERALSCTALKPMGSKTRQLAELAYEFALGGIDIIKDDHGLADQNTAPFRDRVKACVEAVDRAAQKTGRRSRYFPNITTDSHLVFERYRAAAELGADGVLFAPMLSGLATMHYLARSGKDEKSGAHYKDLPIMAHPAFSGSFIASAKSGRATGKPDPIRNHGFDPGLFYGALWRALGADFVIYPNTGGRFAFTQETCESINTHIRRRDFPFEPGFPTPGGGMQLDRMNHWLSTYGTDTTFLLGGSLYEHPHGIEGASRAFMEKIT